MVGLWRNSNILNLFSYWHKNHIGKDPTIIMKHKIDFENEKNTILGLAEFQKFTWLYLTRMLKYSSEATIKNQQPKNLHLFKYQNCILNRVIQQKKISSQSPKIRLSFRYSFMEAEWFLPILQNRRAKGLRRCKKQVSANPSILTLKLKQGMFFHQKNKRN